MAEATIPIIVRDNSPTRVVCPNCEGDTWKVHHPADEVCADCDQDVVLICARCKTWCCGVCGNGPADA